MPVLSISFWKLIELGYPKRFSLRKEQALLFPEQTGSYSADMFVPDNAGGIDEEGLGDSINSVIERNAAGRIIQCEEVALPETPGKSPGGFGVVLNGDTKHGYRIFTLQLLLMEVLQDPGFRLTFYAPGSPEI